MACLVEASSTTGKMPIVHNNLQLPVEVEQQRHYVSSLCANLTRWTLENECNGPREQTEYNLARTAADAAAAAANDDGEQFKQFNVTRQLMDSVDALAMQKVFSRKNFNDQTAASLWEVRSSLDADQPHENAPTLPLTQLVINYLDGPMRSLEGNVNYYFSDIWQTSGDERTNRLPLIGAGPWKLIYATIIYLSLIKWLLPRLMLRVKAFELNWLIRTYNLLMVLSNLFAFYHGARILHFGVKCFGCETINHKDYSHKAIELLHYGWLFFLSRLVEWLDTIFFVLRKKERQVTKLHVFHHSFVPLISWTYLKYHPGYTVAFFPFVNSFVHSIMYTYYLLATFGPKIQPYLWWKRYLTSLQIVQFVLIIIQLASIPLTGDETCQYPRGFLYVAFAGAILFLWLFYTYYLDTYTRNKKRNTIDSIRRKQKQQQQQQQQQQLLMLATSQTKLISTQREGSSRALADVIDNAIGMCEDNQDDDIGHKTKNK